jgi:hypothetical protein
VKCFPLRSDDVDKVVSGTKDVFRLPVALPRLERPAATIRRCSWAPGRCSILDAHGLFLAYVDVPYHGGQVVYVAEEWALFDGEMRCRSLSNGVTKNLKLMWARPEWMPPSLSRQWLKIHSVRPERLQAIAPEDIEREAVWTAPSPKATLPSPGVLRTRFAHAWNATHARTLCWDLNPFVWRIEARKINPRERK